MFVFSPEDAIFVGIEGLTSDVDYTHVGNSVTVLKEALARFVPGDYALSFLFAEDTKVTVSLTVVDTGVQLVSKGTAVLTIGSDSFDAAALALNPSGNGWSWDDNTKILTLDGFEGTYIDYTGDLTVSLSDGGGALASGVRPGNVYQAALYVTGDLSFAGSGTLTITGTGGIRANSVSIQSGKLDVNGYIAASGTMTLDGTADVTASGNISASNSMTIGGTVKAKAGGSITSSDTMEIGDSAEVTANGGSGYAMKAETLRITGGTTVSTGNYGSRFTALTISGGSFTSADRESDGYGSGGLKVGDLTLTGGTLSTTGIMSGLSIWKTLIMSGGTLNATATSKSPSGSAIYLSSSGTGFRMEATGGTLNLSGDYLICSYTTSFPVTLKNVSVTAVTAPKNVLYTGGTGNWTLNNVTFGGSAATNETIYCYNGTVSVRDTTIPASVSGTAFFGGNLTVESGSRITQRIHTWSLRVHGGVIDIPASDTAIRVNSVAIDGGTIKVRGTANGFVSETVVITGSPDVEVSGGERAFSASSVTIGGTSFAQQALYVSIVGGVLKKAFNPPLTLTIGGAQYDVAQLLEGNSGTGWWYEAATNTLELNGYAGDAITIDGEPSITLSGSNTAPSLSITRPANIQGSGSLALTGDAGLSTCGLRLSQATLNTPLLTSTGDGVVQINSGELDADAISCEGALTLAGGSLDSGDIQAGGAFTYSGGTGMAGAVTAAGSVSMTGGSLSCAGLVSTGGNASMTGGSLTTEGALYGLAATDGAVLISGGTLKATGLDLASGIGVFASGALTISGKPNIEAKGYRRALMGSPVKLLGKAFTNASQYVRIANGKLQSASNLPLALKVGDVRFSFDQIKTDLSGEGWFWRASDKQLMLSGYSGGGIAAYIDLNLYLAARSTNTVSSADGEAVYSAKNLNVSGTGRLDLNGYGGLAARGSVTMASGRIVSVGHESKADFGISADGSVKILGGSFSATLQGTGNNAGIAAGSDLLIGGGSVSIQSSMTGTQAIGLFAGKTLSVNGGKVSLSLSSGDMGGYGHSVRIGSADVLVSAGCGFMSETSLSASGSEMNVSASDNYALAARNGMTITSANIVCKADEYDLISEQGTLALSNSTIHSKGSYRKNYYTLAAPKVRVTDSLVIGNDLLYGKISTVGSPIFLYETKTERNLVCSAILTRSFMLLGGYTFVIPEEYTLIIKKGSVLRVAPGSRLDDSYGGEVVGNLEEDPTMVSSITLSGASTVMGGKSTTLRASLTGVGGYTPDVKSLRWTSSDAAVATVDSKGVVTAKKLDSVETVIITATAQDGSGVTGSFNLNVVPFAARIILSPVGAQTIDLASAKQSLQFVAGILPADAGQTVTWQSSNKKIATVDPASGLVTGIAPGAVTITATAADGSKVRASVKVYVTRLVRAVTVTGDDRVVAGRSVQLKTLFDPANASNRSVTWAVDNPLFTVSTKGLVTAKKTAQLGAKVTVTAVCKDAGHASSTYTVTVVPPASTMLLTGFTSPVTLTVKGTLQLTGAVEPAGALQRILWSTSSSKIASVSSTGLVTANKSGTVKITAQAADGSKVKASVIIKVTKQLQRLSAPARA